jgi:epoxyqueuosine reductase
VLIAIGNSGRAELIESALPHLADPSPLVRAMATWALGRLDAERARALASAGLRDETDPQVRAEWQALAPQTEDAA